MLYKSDGPLHVEIRAFSLWLDSIIFNLFCSVLSLIFVRDAFVEVNWELAHAATGTIHMTWSMQQLCTGELVLEESKKQSIKLVQRMWTNYSISLSLTAKSVKGGEKNMHAQILVFWTRHLSLSPRPIKQKREFGTQMPGQAWGIMKFSWDNHVAKFLE